MTFQTPPHALTTTAKRPDGHREPHDTQACCTPGWSAQEAAKKAAKEEAWQAANKGAVRS